MANEQDSDERVITIELIKKKYSIVKDSPSVLEKLELRNADSQKSLQEMVKTLKYFLPKVNEEGLEGNIFFISKQTRRDIIQGLKKRSEEIGKSIRKDLNQAYLVERDKNPGQFNEEMIKKINNMISPSSRFTISEINDIIDKINEQESSYLKEEDTIRKMMSFMDVVAESSRKEGDLLLHWQSTAQQDRSEFSVNKNSSKSPLIKQTQGSSRGTGIQPQKLEPMQKSEIGIATPIKTNIRLLTPQKIEDPLDLITYLNHLKLDDKNHQESFKKIVNIFNDPIKKVELDHIFEAFNSQDQTKLKKLVMKSPASENMISLINDSEIQQGILKSIESYLQEQKSVIKETLKKELITHVDQTKYSEGLKNKVMRSLVDEVFSIKNRSTNDYRNAIQNVEWQTNQKSDILVQMDHAMQAYGKIEEFSKKITFFISDLKNLINTQKIQSGSLVEKSQTRSSTPDLISNSAQSIESDITPHFPAILKNGNIRSKGKRLGGTVDLITRLKSLRHKIHQKINKYQPDKNLIYKKLNKKLKKLYKVVDRHIYSVEKGKLAAPFKFFKASIKGDQQDKKPPFRNTR